MKVIKISAFILSIFFMQSCELVEFQNTEPVGTVEGVRPVYADTEDWDLIQSTDPRPIESLGKIYYKDPYIYVNERSQGIHIIDNSNPTAPVPIHFIQVYGSEDIAIKGNILYTDNITDLVAIDISNPEQVTVTSRVKDLYSERLQNFPDGYSGYFECVDPDRGKVIGWETAILENPSCLR